MTIGRKGLTAVSTGDAQTKLMPLADNSWVQNKVTSYACSHQVDDSGNKTFVNKKFVRSIGFDASIAISCSKKRIARSYGASSGASKDVQLRPFGRIPGAWPRSIAHKHPTRCVPPKAM